MTNFKKYVYIFNNFSLKWEIIKAKTFKVSGVYAVVNNVTGDYYIGSGVCLYGRPASQETISNIGTLKAEDIYL